MLLNRRNEDLHRKAIYARAIPRPPAPRAHQVTTPVRPPSSISGPATALRLRLLRPQRPIFCCHFENEARARVYFSTDWELNPLGGIVRPRPAIYMVGELSQMEHKHLENPRF